ncbi:hypothetical protein ACFUV1_18675 [Streptomyces griseoincarnatus]
MSERYWPINRVAREIMGMHPSDFRAEINAHPDIWRPLCHREDGRSVMDVVRLRRAIGEVTGHA